MMNEALLNARKERGMTQRYIAESIGITVTSYQRYEQTGREPKLSIAMAISDLLDVPIHVLFRNVAKDKDTTAGPLAKGRKGDDDGKAG